MPDEPPREARKEYTPFPRAESFLGFMCLVAPGMTAGVLAAAWPALVSRVHGLAPAVVVTVLVPVLFGGCYCAGWIAAVKVPEERRKKEMWKGILAALVLQIPFIPMSGLMTYGLVERLIQGP